MITNSFFLMIWLLSMIGLFPIAISPLALASSAIITDKIETRTNSSRKLINDKETNNINLQRTTTPNTTTTILEKKEWILSVSIGNIFRVICSWISEMIQRWTFYWWPATKKTTIPDVDIKVFHDGGKISMINVTNINSISPSLPLPQPPPPKEHLQSVVHSIVLQAGGPTGQPSRQPTRQPTGQPSRQPSSQPSRQPTSRPSRPSGQPSRQPTR